MKKLTETARDELLVRLDERTESIIRELTSQNSHLERINGSIGKHEESIVTIHTTLYGSGSDKGLCHRVDKNSGNIVKFMVVLAVVAGGVGGGVAEIIKLFA
ncbi:MAG: hypothetical protein WC479_05900 [Candidatus Izemoplasmatales bacterium]